MAGAVGFEPTHGGTKNRCRTAWLRPKGSRVYHKNIWHELQLFVHLKGDLFKN